MSSEPLVSDLSEDQLLARILPVLAAPANALIGPGDDCAVVAAPDARYVVTTDVLVENRHFRLAWSTGYDVGWRAAMQNLADVVAMGARPSALVVGLVLPPAVTVTFVEGLARGMAAACASVGAGVVGGDLSSGDQLVVAVTAHGNLEGREPVVRSGARIGDIVAVAGTLGRSAAGLALLDAGWVSSPPSGSGGASPADEILADLVAAYLRPDPPLGAATGGATAMLDVSDGLLRDAARLARASGVAIDLRGAELAEDVVAVRSAADHLHPEGSSGDAARSWVLTGGEDHALLATFAPDRPLPHPFRAIGVVTVGATGAVLLDGVCPPVAAPGWDHFAVS